MATATEPEQKSFYDAVSDLAKTVEVAVRDIRVHQKPAGFRFSDLKGFGPYKDDFGLVERVTEEYLQQTGADICVFRRPNDFRNAKNAIAENTSTAPFMVTEWEKYYGKKAVADHWIRNMQNDIDESVGFALDRITTETTDAPSLVKRAQETGQTVEQQLRKDIAHRVGNDFFSIINGVWREVYDALNIKENPELLYALAFNTEAEKRGFHQKTGDELATLLHSQKISVNEFEYYTRRDLAAEQEEKIRAQQPAQAPATQTAQVQQPARPTQTTGGIDANDIGAAVDAAERGETVRQTTPPQPRVYTEPYVLRNIRCVGSDGNIFEQYAELRIQPDVVRRQNNVHQSFTPYQAILHFKTQPEQFLPSMALSCNVLVGLFRAAVRRNDDGTYTTLDEHAKQILDQYKDYGLGYGWHAQNTVVDWRRKNIIHYPNDTDFPEHGGNAQINLAQERIPKPFNKEEFESCTLEAACQKPNMLTYLQDFTGLQNPRELGEVATYFGRTAKVWVSSENKTRAAWLGCDYINGILGLLANDYLIGSIAARGVASNNAP